MLNQSQASHEYPTERKQLLLFDEDDVQNH